MGDVPGAADTGSYQSTTRPSVGNVVPVAEQGRDGDGYRRRDHTSVYTVMYGRRTWTQYKSAMFVMTEYIRFLARQG